MQVHIVTWIPIKRASVKRGIADTQKHGSVKKVLCLTCGLKSETFVKITSKIAVKMLSLMSFVTVFMGVQIEINQRGVQRKWQKF